jgi:hypothetical protein
VAAVPSGLSLTSLRIKKNVLRELAASIFRTEKYLCSENVGRGFLQTIGMSLDYTIHPAGWHGGNAPDSYLEGAFSNLGRHKIS